jgi:Transposase DDE domain group 1
VRRIRLVGAQAELFPNWRYHAFVTDRVGTASGWTKIIAATPSSSCASATSKPGSGGGTALRGSSTPAWLLIATLAHNLLRWIAQIGLDARQELMVAKTLRTPLALPGRITRSARRWKLHLPAGWPWAAWFELALARLRCVAYAT